MDWVLDDHRKAARSGRRYVLGAAALWSLGGVFAKALDLDGLTVAFYRSLFAGLVLLPFVPASRRVIRPTMIPLGFTFGAMTGLYLSAVMTTTAANAIFLQCTATIWTIPLSAWLLRERPDRRSIVGIALASLGVVAIVFYGYDGRPNEGQGIALGLASGVGYAGVVVGLRGFRDLDPIWLSAFNNLAASGTLALWILLTRGSIQVPPASTIVLLVVFGTIQMAIPYGLFARGLRDIGAPEAGLLGLLEPVLAPIWVLLVIGERPAVPTIVGGLFLLVGVACRYWPVTSRNLVVAEAVHEHLD
ncbi:Permease of the drug/metabolite transporter (DMT) superfamily [Singulisphaera sp. GP187]|uniref:DMT family transporter n=1 Tax=Singulisphaera sp. GP187 TaxID=1882752 RepID=UPI000926EE2B|nr:EamA family transporter [Singulisphaera sp. GP187]SIO64834.1 Permease of the drug/metabolite transporter (DMT) superfamily [Singulisphaera sp. GP187]